ncbi:MAG: methyl-accepting chemotaxis protein [Maricaulaceae bacterium]
MTTHNLQDRLNFHRIDAETKARLRSLKPFLSDILPAALDDFYKHLRAFPHVWAVFDGAVEHVKSKQIQHWMVIADAQFDSIYVDSVTRIWTTHAKLDLDASFFMGGYSLLTSYIQRAIVEHFTPKGWRAVFAANPAADYVEAINRAVLLDLDFAVEIYNSASEQTRHSGIQAIAQTFEDSILKLTEELAAASAALEAGADTVRTAMSDANQTTANAAASAEQATSNVSVVAAAAEQMGASVREIATQVSHSADIAGKAVARAASAGDTITSLSEAASKIGDVVRLISDIAEQTNLLALNATIESARAGEAGKGFAVVAQEVKTLAGQTAKATEDIAQQIQAMQAATKDSVEAIGAIRSTIDEINTVAVSINAAIEEQSASTQEIARNTQEAATGTQSVSEIIAEANAASDRADGGAREVGDTAQSLATRIASLQTEVSRFLENLRAA